MPDKKISQLTSLAQGDIASTTDVLAIVDTSATETKKATPAAIVGAAAAAGLTNVDINSGAIDGTAIGANSASTGAFTTLSASGSVTLSGGTANGVLYLNGSKVATSGSGLTFDGTNFASTGIITSTNANGLRAQYPVSASYYAQLDSRDGNTYLSAIGSTAAIVFRATDGPGTTAEGMRLTSTGLGIGTSSPAYKLDVNGVIATGSGANRGFFYNDGSKILVESSSTYPLSFAVNSAVRATIDSSGNLGLGVTPSAWSGGGTARAIQIGNYSSLFSNAAGNTSSALTHNAYFDGTNWRYLATSVGATRYEMTGANAGSTHSWSVSAGGTAGNAISFTQAMTLDASGNLIVGGTTAGNTSSGRGNITISGSSNSILNLSTGSTVKGYLYNDGTDITLYADAVTKFSNNGSERARITAGGEFLLSGLTSSVGSYWLQIKNTGSSANGAYMENASGNDRGILVMKHDQAAGATTGAMIVFQNSSGSTVGSITSSNTATAYNLSSDRRLKENIASADDAGSLIDNIEVVKFDWKVGGHNRYGFIAQDLHAVAPEAVTAGDAGDEIEKVWGVDYSKLVPMLVKEIQSLRARVAQLESK